ncbi:hypothetical protein FNV43_RR17054 [Rhamnella rubrinervis]|uniref:Uncharacterized protein n=1 Tax=Rhamnella rubrinervis TaxID=2594499 RepID=A0A8K0H026_9ROSA|nr:hypothetical protein FNV43_RR17054 [Rhamnella rubrinervis]
MYDIGGPTDGLLMGTTSAITWFHAFKSCFKLDLRVVLVLIVALMVQNPEKPSKLKERQLKKFKKSCFGTLILRIQELGLSDGIIHDMIGRQADSLNNDVMEFNFNGKGAIFT